jgi:hypothetical protein
VQARDQHALLARAQRDVDAAFIFFRFFGVFSGVSESGGGMRGGDEWISQRNRSSRLTTTRTQHVVEQEGAPVAALERLRHEVVVLRHVRLAAAVVFSAFFCFVLGGGFFDVIFFVLALGWVEKRK